MVGRPGPVACLRAGHRGDGIQGAAGAFFGNQNLGQLAHAIGRYRANGAWNQAPERNAVTEPAEDCERAGSGHQQVEQGLGKEHSCRGELR
ncbi:hypothetical protein D3C74_402160 [compost metagenome]